MRRRAAVLIIWLTPAVALATSFNCDKARSDAEQLICSDPDLSRMDDDLAALYGAAKQAASDKAGFKKQNRDEWEYREKTCHDKPCLTTWYAHRTQQLQAILLAKPTAKIFHVRSFDALGCSDYTVIPELQYLQGRDADRWMGLAQKGGCTPVNPDLNLELESVRTWKVPAGTYEIGYVKLRSTLLEGEAASDSYFFVLMKDLVPAR